jgi:DNA-binding transcriptional regulator YhcF (GntR family)
MIQWFVDKASKMPLYLQLKDQIEYYISTGAIQDKHQLPPVYELAETLGINFETVRKAYKELQQEGLISMKRGQGTFITLHSNGRAKQVVAPVENAAPEASDGRPALLEAARQLVAQARRLGIEQEELQRLVAEACEQVMQAESGPVVIFTECNQLQVREISEYLKQQLQLSIQPVLLDDLAAALTTQRALNGRPLNVITTGFHINEVRATVSQLPEHLAINLDVLITNMSPETRRKIDALGRDAKLGFICRDQESAQLYRDLLRIELENEALNLTCCTLAEKEQVRKLYKTAALLLVSPPVYEEVRNSAPAKLPVVNVFDRVDPMSLRVIKDRLSSQKQPPTN